VITKSFNLSAIGHPSAPGSSSPPAAYISAAKQVVGE
jgi:hypothetical protein